MKDADFINLMDRADYVVKRIFFIVATIYLRMLGKEIRLYA